MQSELELTILDRMYTLLFSFILCVTESAIEFSILIILSNNMQKPKLGMISTKYLYSVLTCEDGVLAQLSEEFHSFDCMLYHYFSENRIAFGGWFLSC